MHLYPDQLSTQSESKTAGHFLFKGVMADIQQRQGGVKGVVVFYVAGNEDVRSGPGGCLDERGSGSGTVGYATETAVVIRRKGGQAGAVQVDVSGKPGEQRIKGQRLGKHARTAEAPERTRLARAGFKDAQIVEFEFPRQPTGRAVHDDVQRAVGGVEGYVSLEKQREHFMETVEQGGKTGDEQQGMMRDQQLGFKLYCTPYGRRTWVKAEGKGIYGVIAAGKLHAGVVPACRAAQRGYSFYFINYFT